MQGALGKEDGDVSDPEFRGLAADAHDTADVLCDVDGWRADEAVAAVS
jgi:hypothetical protein